MDPRLFSHPGFVTGVLGLLGIALGVYFSRHGTWSRREKRARILFTAAVLVLVALNHWLQSSVESAVVAVAASVVFLLVLLGLCLVHHRFLKRLEVHP